MKVEFITKEDLEQFRLDLLRDLKQVVAPQNNQSSQWLRSAEVRKLLKISPGTLQTLRISGQLPFAKVGSIHYYKQQDIQDLLKGGNDGKD